MKRVKIMLSVLAIVAVVGAALAFKASKYTVGQVYCKVPGQTTCQPVAFLSTYTDISTIASTTINPCTAPFTTFNHNGWYTTRAANLSCTELTTTTTAFKDLVE